MKTISIRRATSIALLAATLFAVAGSISPVEAQPTERCFPETGHCISGAIRQYWERNGGLAVFGYPISSVRRETIEASWTGPVQWFERDRLEDHAGEGVLAGRLGAQTLEIQGINWQALPGDEGTIPGCRFFRETQFNLCGQFLRYWERNGGLERFGYPLTRERQELIDGREYTVQYFERRRMELHPENAGTPYEVLLGLLGRDVFAATGGGNPMPIASGDLDTTIQQAILDTAYARMRADYPGARVIAGLVDVIGDYALVIARPNAGRKGHVYLARQGEGWVVVAVSTALGPERARRNGFPEQLLGPSDREAIVSQQLFQLMDAQLSAYITRPRVAGEFARFYVVPAPSENLDSLSVFYQRRGGLWEELTGGTAFPEDQLAQMGIPRELWPYGESVKVPE